jgi:hypothetical protein
MVSCQIARLGHGSIDADLPRLVGLPTSLLTAFERCFMGLSQSPSHPPRLRPEASWTIMWLPTPSTAAPRTIGLPTRLLLACLMGLSDSVDTLALRASGLMAHCVRCQRRRLPHLIGCQRVCCSRTSWVCPSLQRHCLPHQRRVPPRLCRRPKRCAASLELMNCMATCCTRDTWWYVIQCPDKAQ